MNNKMNYDEVVKYLKTLDRIAIEDLFIELGAFRTYSTKSEIEDICGVDLYYDEYKNEDDVTLFVMPSQLDWDNIDDEIPNKQNTIWWNK